MISDFFIWLLLGIVMFIIIVSMVMMIRVISNLRICIILGFFECFYVVFDGIVVIVGKFFFGNLF